MNNILVKITFESLVLKRSQKRICLNDEDFSKTIGSTDTSIGQLTKKEINRLQKISFNPFKLNLQNDNHLLIDDNDIESGLLRKVNDRISECDYYLVDKLKQFHKTIVTSHYCI